jgi:hypothetical protein
MECVCGYTALKATTVHRHEKTCKVYLLSQSNKCIELTTMKVTHLEEKVRLLQEQLIEKKQDYQKEMAAKDQQIKELIKVAKKPRTSTVHNTTHKYIVEHNVNPFGKESIEHISPRQIQALLADPANAVPQLIKLKHRRAPGGVNQNVRVPNQKRAIYQVVVPGEEGENEWENMAKGDVLEQLYDENSSHLEAEADEETNIGARFLDHQDKVKASAAATAEDGGRRYKEQLDKIHCVVST